MIIDSLMSLRQALKQNPNSKAPDEIISKLKLVDVEYYSFDDELHKGQIVVHEDLGTDVQELFKLILNIKFPIKSVIPISDPRFSWDDEKSMQANNSSGFNYRTIRGTNRMSNHSLGRAIDINTFLNPYIRKDGVWPRGALYNPQVQGTITENSEITKFMKSKAWYWGGDWTDRKDYQHFENRNSPG